MINTYLLLIWTNLQKYEDSSPSNRQKELDSIMVYLKNLSIEGKLISANPIELSGMVLTNNSILDKPRVFEGSLVTGYFIIKATSIDEIISIAKENPLAKDHIIEIRPFLEVK